jgi:UDP-N-acetyl-D-mannosaminuronic acid dehydrogenase
MNENSPLPAAIESSSCPGQPAHVCVVGLGYIGLPTAAILAGRGYTVTGVDVRPEVVETVNAGRIHIHEPDLDVLVRSVVESGRLRARTAPVAADVFILCVPTPHHADHAPDLTYVERAAQSIRPHVRRGNLIILESTSPPRTTEDVVVPQAVPADWTVGRDVFVAHCPERVLPGRILIEAVHNDRVIGGLTPACTARARALYETFVHGEILTTSAVSAELTKLVENAYRDVNIAFANELSMLAARFQADPWEIISLANRHPRVQILSPGPGVGGHCISVDPWFLVHAAPELTPLMRTAREVNDRKPHFVVQQVIEATSGLKSPVIGCLGLAYKADVDDLRESPALHIVRKLRSCSLGEVLACEPYVTAEQFQEFPLTPLEEVLRRAQVLVLLTDHRPFRELRPEALAGKVLVDTRACWRHLPAPRGGRRAA